LQAARLRFDDHHVHLLLTPKKAQAVPRLVISLGRRYVQYINRSYRRTGTLWDSRYKSTLVQVETHLLACQRYIELNPVRAAMVDDSAIIAGPAIARMNSATRMRELRRMRCM
jgi:REP element-mobilizing transposase RayT